MDIIIISNIIITSLKYDIKLFISIAHIFACLLKIQKAFGILHQFQNVFKYLHKTCNKYFQNVCGNFFFSGWQVNQENREKVGNFKIYQMNSIVLVPMISIASEFHISDNGSSLKTL